MFVRMYHLRTQCSQTSANPSWHRQRGTPLELKPDVAPHADVPRAGTCVRLYVRMSLCTVRAIRAKRMLWSWTHTFEPPSTRRVRPPVTAAHWPTAIATPASAWDCLAPPDHRVQSTGPSSTPHAFSTRLKHGSACCTGVATSAQKVGSRAAASSTRLHAFAAPVRHGCSDQSRCGVLARRRARWWTPGARPRSRASAGTRIASAAGANVEPSTIAAAAGVARASLAFACAAAERSALTVLTSDRMSRDNRARSKSFGRASQSTCTSSHQR